MVEKGVSYARYAAYCALVWLLTACVYSKINIPAEGDSSRLKGYSRKVLTPGKHQIAWKGAGIEVAEGDRALVLVSLANPKPANQSKWALCYFNARAGEAVFEDVPERTYFLMPGSGNIKFGASCAMPKKSSVMLPMLIIDTFVVDEANESYLPGILCQVRNPLYVIECRQAKKNRDDSY